MAENKNQHQSLEDELKTLENIVAELEKGNLGLEKALKTFEKGIHIYKNCRKQIDTFEKKISKLTEDLQEEKIDFD